MALCAMQDHNIHFVKQYPYIGSYINISFDILDTWYFVRRDFDCFTF